MSLVPFSFEAKETFFPESFGDLNLSKYTRKEFHPKKIGVRLRLFIVPSLFDYFPKMPYLLPYYTKLTPPPIK